MNSFSIAFKMFKTNLKTYGYYLAVMIFAAAVYYDFMVLKYDPGFLKAKDAIQAARIASSVTSFILVVFLFFFIWYSSSFFLKQRKKEIAIYSLMGISNRKIGCVFAIESLFTGIVSVGTGLAFGILFSRLFLMAVAKVALLDVTVGFSVPMQGVTELIIVFGVIFLVLSVHSFINVAHSKLIELITDSRKEEKEPKFKAVRAVFSIILIVAGYILSKKIAYDLIVVILVVIGTFWLFGALVPAVAKLLTNKKSILYKGVRIVSINNIAFRIRTNYRSLAMLAVMTATTLTAFGTSLSLRYYADETRHLEFPYSFSYFLNDKNTEDRVIESINSSKHRLLLKERIGYIDVKVAMDAGNGYEKYNSPAIKYSDFLKLSEDMKKQYPGKVPDFKEIKGKQVIMVVSPATVGGFFTFEGKDIDIENKDYSIVREMKTPVFGSGKLYQENCLVISDAEYEKLAKNHNKIVFNGFIVSDPKNSLELAKSIQGLLPKDVRLSAYVAEYMAVYSFMGLFYFLGTFMSIVFIFATGSIMYFKILSEGLADKAKYDILRKIGMTAREIRSAVSMQVGLSLILPLAVGIIHSLFAIDALRNMLGFSLVVPMLTAILIYAVFYAFFYAATARKFMKLVYQ